MSAPQMMAACPKYDAQKCGLCKCQIEHEYNGNRCRKSSFGCPACTPLPAAEQPAACRWTQDANDCWKTSCGHAYAINDGTPVENEMKHCVYCGKQIEQVVFIEEGDMEDEDAAKQPPRKTVRERIEEEMTGGEVLALQARGFVGSMPPIHPAIERLIIAADAREDALRKEVECKALQIRNLCADWAEDHTALQAIAVQAGVSKEKTVGDSYGVPGIVDLAEMALAVSNRAIEVLQLAVEIANGRTEAAEQERDIAVAAAQAQHDAYEQERDTLRERVRELEQERDNRKAAFDAMAEAHDDEDRRDERDRLDRMVQPCIPVMFQALIVANQTADAVDLGGKALAAIDALLAQRKERK